MGKKLAIETASLKIHIAVHHEAGSGGPQDVDVGGVVLPAVVLDRGKEASAAIGIAMLVDIAASRAGILKDLPVVVAVLQHLGLHGAHLGVGLHVAIEGLEPALGRAHVAVEQHGILVAGGLDATVVALGKAIVLVEEERVHRGKLLGEHLAAVVSAAVVGHNHVGNIGVGAREHTGQVASQQLGAIPVQYDHSYVFHIHFRLFLRHRQAAARGASSGRGSTAILPGTP